MYAWEGMRERGMKMQERGGKSKRKKIKMRM